MPLVVYYIAFIVIYEWIRRPLFTLLQNRWILPVEWIRIRSEEDKIIAANLCALRKETIKLKKRAIALRAEMYEAQSKWIPIKLETEAKYRSVEAKRPKALKAYTEAKENIDQNKWWGSSLVSSSFISITLFLLLYYIFQQFIGVTVDHNSD